MNKAESDNAVANDGYTAEGIACYIYPQQAAGAVPLYRAYQPATNDHFYTTNLAEHQNAVQNLGYSDEGVTGHVIANPADGVTPFYRLFGAAVAPTYSSRKNLQQMAGWIQVDVTSAGVVTYSGHVHNDAAIAEAFDFAVRAVVGKDHSILVQYSGHVGGTGATADQRNCYWTQTETRPDVAANYAAIAKANTFNVYESRQGSVTGVLEEIGAFLVNWISGQIAVDNAAVGLVLFSLAESIGLATGNGVATAEIIEGVLWLKGPYGTLFSLVADGVAAIGQRRRQMTEVEYTWANNAVFGGTLPDRTSIYITDTTGAENRSFTFPEVDGTISVNLGPAYYDNPMDGYDSVFIHELTHAWQIHHTTFDIGWMAQELAAQLSSSTSYDFVAGLPFETYNPEQQAMIVQTWYASGMPASGELYPYIQNNIRVGRP